MEYGTYIASAAWRTNPARLAELKASGNRCRICNAGGKEVELQVHHRTYERLGCELPSDLTALCIDCHLGVTALLRERRYAARVPQRADAIRPLVNAIRKPTGKHGETDEHRIRFLALDRHPSVAHACGPPVRPAGSDLARAREDYRKAIENRF